MSPTRKPPAGPTVTPTATGGPTLTSIVPDSLEVGSPPATVDLYGTGFDTTSTVQAAGVARATFFLDNTHLQYTARPDIQNGAQTVEVTIQNGDGTISNALPFSFTGPPGTATVGFWQCECGVAVSSSSPRPAPPVCVCGRNMVAIVNKVPKVLFEVVWVEQQDQRNR